MAAQRSSSDSISALDCDPASTPRSCLSFLCFGVLVATQFSVVVTAANDLVRDRAPVGLILFAYTVPSVLVRVLVPFARWPKMEVFWSSSHLPVLLSRLNGKDADKSYDSAASMYSAASSLNTHINYPLRLTICALNGFLGLQLLSWAPYTAVRLLGIAMASLSSNLGDMSFLQLCSHYHTDVFSYYSMGGGYAAFAGSLTYAAATSLLEFSPSSTISVIGFLPLLILVIYCRVLPAPVSTPAPQANGGESISSLPTLSKLRIARQLFWSHMAPLALVMLLENTVVQGVLPTLLFTLPLSDRVLGRVFRHPRSFYTFYVALYQLCIFLGRSLITLTRLPRSRFLAVVQAVILVLQVCESTSMDADDRPLYGLLVVLLLVAVMGVVGGMAFSETYARVRGEGLPADVWRELGRARGGYQVLGCGGDGEDEVQMREFLISVVAGPDTVAVLVAAVVGMGVQRGLCGIQVGGGREGCLGAGR